MPDIYNMPVKVFHQVIETNNLNLLFYRKPKHQHAKRIRKCPGLAGIMWEKINAQLIREFGVSKEFELMFYKQRDVNNLEIALLAGDRSAEFLINTYRSDIDRIRNGMAKVTDYRKYHAQMHRAITARYNRDSHSLTVFEFYNDVHDMQVEAEERELSIAYKQAQ